ncbi:DbpA RNA binding domain-containing protein [Methylosarcina fibrata]|uniref:DbpA RNA binding domain-containing protein n=1 Tax=Methylosarcina fibrata TaxID=105972 RepID=UPI00036E0D6F|nr:DbpA RNA binding domain-containing protein [Methylosarcina fibrata]
MDIISTMPTARSKNDEALKTSLQRILDGENLENQRALTKYLVTELGVDFLDFSAALLYLYQQHTPPLASSLPEPTRPGQYLDSPVHPEIKMVRYKLSVGQKHRVSLEELTKVLVEESGVDKNYIRNVDIQNLYTFIELPDEMPHDIFLHLKSVEINQQKLDIKRVKAHHSKKRVRNRSRKTRPKKPKSSHEF